MTKATSVRRAGHSAPWSASPLNDRAAAIPAAPGLGASEEEKQQVVEYARKHPELRHRVFSICSLATRPGIWPAVSQRLAHIGLSLMALASAARVALLTTT
jgi:hypothetical protein